MNNLDDFEQIEIIFECSEKSFLRDQQRKNIDQRFEMFRFVSKSKRE